MIRGVSLDASCTAFPHSLRRERSLYKYHFRPVPTSRFSAHEARTPHPASGLRLDARAMARSVECCQRFAVVPLGGSWCSGTCGCTSISSANGSRSVDGMDGPRSTGLGSWRAGSRRPWRLSRAVQLSPMATIARRHLRPRPPRHILLHAYRARPMGSEHPRDPTPRRASRTVPRRGRG